jgi:hypothetical protein
MSYDSLDSMWLPSAHRFVCKQEDCDPVLCPNKKRKCETTAMSPSNDPQAQLYMDRLNFKPEMSCCENFLVQTNVFQIFRWNNVLRNVRKAKLEMIFANGFPLGMQTQFLASLSCPELATYQRNIQPALNTFTAGDGVLVRSPIIWIQPLFTMDTGTGGANGTGMHLSQVKSHWMTFDEIKEFDTLSFNLNSFPANELVTSMGYFVCWRLTTCHENIG